MFHRKFKPNVPQIAGWNNLGHLIAADSDFFTLDPNLATALKNSQRRGHQQPPKPSQNVDQPRKKEGLGGEIGEEWVVPVCECIALALAAPLLLLPGSLARVRQGAADALRIAHAGAGRRLAAPTANFLSRRPAPSLRRRRATSCCLRKTTIWAAPQLWWIGWRLRARGDRARS